MFEDLKPHLVELKKRVLVSVGAVFILFLLTFSFWKPIVSWMSAPLFETIKSENITDDNASSKSFLDSLMNFDMPQNVKNSSFMMTNHPLEAILMAIKIAFFAAVIFALPIIFWQFWLFVAPGLYDHEKRYVVPFVLFATTMFLVGAAFCYYIVLPMSLKFIIKFGEGLFVYIPKIDEYTDFFIKLMMGFGISFEFPVVTLFLAKVGFITDKTLKSFFRYAIVLIFIFAAVITPPDVLSQILMAIPLLLLYGLSILIVRMVNPYKEKETDQ